MNREIAPSLAGPDPELHPGMQGILRVAVGDREPRLLVTLGQPPAGESAYALDERHYTLTGGQQVFPRITGARLAQPQGNVVELTLDRRGDSSLYTLTLSGAKVDPVFASSRLRFDIDHDATFDCRVPPAAMVAPIEPAVAIDYLAKDYASFRQALLDFIPTRLPTWVEQSEADLGVMVLDLLAATADTLSYMQDRVASEAFLSTATQRRSLAAHLALLGYEIDNGAAAYTWLLFSLDAQDAVVALPTNPGLRVSNEPDGPDDAVIVFETVQAATLRGEHSAMALFDWGHRHLRLPRTSLSASLIGAYPYLRAGDYLLIDDGNGAADVIRLTAAPTVATQPSLEGGAARVTLTAIRWSDATPLSRDYDCQATVVRGNLVLATHGETIVDEVLRDGGQSAEPALAGRTSRLRLTLSQAPLALLDRGGPAFPEQEMVRPAAPGRFTAQPARSVSTLQITVDGERWYEQRSLLNSGPTDPAFRLELDERGYATVVFGDGVFGRRPPETATIKATYRVGNGTAGNVAANALTRMQPYRGEAAIWRRITGVTNPRPATGGRDQESDDYARLFGPPSTHQALTAVSPDGYRSAMLEYVGADGTAPIRHASAAYDWTGSWSVASLRAQPRSGRSLDAALRQALLSDLAARRMAGYDVELAAPSYLPIDLVVDIRTDPASRMDDVLCRLQRALSNVDLPDGGKGFFHPDNFDFGESLYISRLYRAILAVAGVASADITRLAPAGSRNADRETRANLRQGYLRAAPDQIIILDNDRDRPLNGVLIIRPKGVARW